MNKNNFIKILCAAGTAFIIHKIVKTCFKNHSKNSISCEVEQVQPHVFLKPTFEVGQQVLFKSNTPLGVDSGYIQSYDEESNTFLLCDEDGKSFVVRAKNLYHTIEDAFPELRDIEENA